MCKKENSEYQPNFKTKVKLVFYFPTNAAQQGQKRLTRPNYQIVNSSVPRVIIFSTLKMSDFRRQIFAACDIYHTLQKFAV